MAEAASKLPETKEKTGDAPRELEPFQNLRREIDRVFDSFRQGFWRSPIGSVLDIEPFWRKESEWAMSPAVDIVDTDGRYELRAELPGMDAKDIEVKFADGVLTIQGEKREEKEEKKDNYYLSERRHGTFRRSFAMPRTADPEKIDAQFKNGVLTVTFAKAAEPEKMAKKIDVKAN